MPDWRIRVGVVLGVGLFLVVVAMMYLSPHAYLAPDSFTYFAMAKEFHESGLPYSYSGIDHTTGVHPGFYFLMVLLYPLFGLALPAWSFVVGGTLVAAGLFALYRAYGLLFSAVALVGVLTTQGLEVTNNGMESALLFFALAWLVLLLEQIDTQGFSFARAGALGALLALAMLARLDTAFLVFGVGVALGARALISLGLVRGFLHLIQPGAIALMVFILLLTPALLWNVVFGGSVLPVSGGLKSSFPNLSGHVFETLISLKLFLLAVFSGAVYLGWSLIQKRTEGTALFGFFIGTFLLYFYNGLFVSDLGAWYGTLPFFLLLLVVGKVLQEVCAVLRPRTSILLAFFAGSLLLVSFSHATLIVEDWVTPHREAADFLKTLCSSGQRVGELKDGVFAFYATMPVYSLTGLANNDAYIQAQRGGEIQEYLEERHIEYIIGGSLYSGVQVPGATEDFRDCTDPIYDKGFVRIYETKNCML